MQKFLLVIFLGLLLFINEAFSTGYMSFDEYKIVYEKSYSEDEHHTRLDVDSIIRLWTSINRLSTI